MKSEYRQWCDEIEPPPRLTVAERWALWFAPRSEPEPCPYRWLSVSDLIPIEGE